jgi:hypothetical protein
MEDDLELRDLPGELAPLVEDLAALVEDAIEGEVDQHGADWRGLADGDGVVAVRPRKQIVRNLPNQGGDDIRQLAAGQEPLCLDDGLDRLELFLSRLRIYFWSSLLRDCLRRR